MERAACQGLKSCNILISLDKYAARFAFDGVLREVNGRGYVHPKCRRKEGASLAFRGLIRVRRKTRMNFYFCVCSELFSIFFKKITAYVEYPEVKDHVDNRKRGACS